MSGGSLGATVVSGGVAFAVWSSAAQRIWVSIFDEAGEFEIARHELSRGEDEVWTATVPGLKAGARYGLRADGPYDPDAGLWFDPQKLLVDPYAMEIDRTYRYLPQLAAPPGESGDTAALMPKAIVTLPERVSAAKPIFRPGGFIYEVNVRAFTMRHPQVPEALRGTIGALALPAIVEHLQRLGVSAVELMPVTAWIDERHLPPLGLKNAWGYNPVTFMALDPRLAPGGLAELRDTVAALRRAGIGTILDLVFNHTGESDRLGPTLSLRGLDARAYYRHSAEGLVNDSGTGNTLACDRPVVRRLILDSLRHFVLHAGVDGFRFDLASILARNDRGLDPEAPILKEICADPVLADRVMIAEPWDIGAGGYQLGNFPPRFLEWNDRYRDDLRRFWRGDRGALGDLATRLAGSADVFQRQGATATRTVNFVAAHDGFALADVVAYGRKHNNPNGESDRDGHHENFSWNNGVEGPSDDPALRKARGRDVLALLATLFASRGTVMLTAGDEFGRSQGGNNNAYAQDNETTWLDWTKRDEARETYVAALAGLRERFAALRQTEFLTGDVAAGDGLADVQWLAETGAAMEASGWHDPERRRLTMVLATRVGRSRTRLAVSVNGDRRAGIFALPEREGWRWRILLPSPGSAPREVDPNAFLVEGRTVLFLEEGRA